MENPIQPLYERKVGALWLKTNKAKEQFLSGEIIVKGETIRILIMRNKNKTKPEYPDYEIFLTEAKLNTDLLGNRNE